MSRIDACTVIEAESLLFRYDRKPVLKDVSFTIRAGEMVTIIGPNGGGKSTLLKLILGLEVPERGKLEVLGRDPRDSRSAVGYVPQYARFDERFPITVGEVVLTGRIRRRFGFYSRADRARAGEAMERVGVAELARDSFAELSGGQRQRVLIARALVGDPRILLLDEPTANVDAFMSERFVRLVAELARERTVLFVTHDSAYVSGITDRVLCVNTGVEEHPSEEVGSGLVHSAYLGGVRSVRHDIRIGAGGAGEERE